jgi:hypothetical protein
MDIAIISPLLIGLTGGYLAVGRSLLLLRKRVVRKENNDGGSYRERGYLRALGYTIDFWGDYWLYALRLIEKQPRRLS